MNTDQNKSLRTRFAWRAGYLLAAFGVYSPIRHRKRAVKTLRFGEDRVLIRGFLQFAYTEKPRHRVWPASGRRFVCALVLRRASQPPRRLLSFTIS